MAVDYGDVRTGLALCDKTEFLASPVGTVQAHTLEHCVEQVAYAVEEFGAEMVIVGLPINMDGSEGGRAEKCRTFAKALEEAVGVEVSLWDERRSTIAADDFLKESTVKSKKKKEVIDQVAATIILDSYLQYRKNMGIGG